MAARSLTTKLENFRKRLPVVGPLLLYWLPLPLFPSIFIALARGNFVNFAAALASFIMLVLAAWTTRLGMKRDMEIDRLGWTRIPPVPLKLIGGLSCGLAMALCSFFIIGHSELASAAMGVTTLAGVLLSYDIDGLFYRWARRDPLASRDREVADALQEARIKIDGICAANRQIRNPELKRRVRRITRQAIDILTTIADDPTTLRQARRFLKVYLDGVQRVTEGYAEVHLDERTAALEDNFRNVLITIEDTFGEQQRKLREKDLLDLDIQIEVLATQLKNEGII